MVYVKAAVLHAQKDHAGAAAALAEARPLTPAVAGTMTWSNKRKARFLDLTDSDDLTGPMLPCYDRETVLELPYSELRSIQLLFGSTSFDAMWIPADVVTVEGKALRNAGQRAMDLPIDPHHQAIEARAHSAPLDIVCCASSASRPVRMHARTATERDGFVPGAVTAGTSASTRATVVAERRVLMWLLDAAGRAPGRGFSGVVDIGWASGV